MGRLSKELAMQAKRKGICETWFNELRSLEDKEKMIEMYLKGIDFCLSNDYPSNDYIRKNFKGVMEPFGIHLDEEFKVKNPAKIVALGTCFGTIEMDDYSMSEVFIKNGSDIVLLVRGNAFVMVDMFDNSALTIIARDMAKVCVNRYGGQIDVSNYDRAAVKIKEKNKKTY